MNDRRVQLTEDERDRFYDDVAAAWKMYGYELFEEYLAFEGSIADGLEPESEPFVAVPESTLQSNG